LPGRRGRRRGTARRRPDAATASAGVGAATWRAAFQFQARS
jgi:hypothetical protein